MSRSKKGFTIVELVIVIAVIAILAAVLIPSFSSLNKKAKDSAYLQERTNQQIADLAEKVENQKFLTWEDLEAKLAEEIAKIEIPATGLTEAQVTDAIAKAIAKLENSLKTDDTALTEAQVKAIVEKALEGQLTTAQVEAIVNAAVKNIPEASTLSADQVKAIVENAVAGLNKETGITKEEMASAIETALKAQPGLEAADVTTIINNALAGFGYGNDLSASQIENIINNAMGKVPATADEQAAEEMTAVIANAASFEDAVKALTAAGYNVSALTPIRTGYVFCIEANAVKCVKAEEVDTNTMKDIVAEGAGLVVADVKDTASLKKAVANGNAVTLKADITTSNIQAPEDMTMTIDLGGKTLSTTAEGERHDYAIDVYGTVTITNGTIGARGVQVRPGGKLIIGEGVTINALDSNGGAAIWVYENAELEINGGTFSALNGKNDGDVTNIEPGAVYNKGKIVINGGTFESDSDVYAIVNDISAAEIVINGGTFKSNRGVISANAGSVTINDGTFVVTGDSPIAAHVVYAYNGIVTINGGTFTNNGGSGCFKFCVDGKGTGSITVDGGTLTAGQSK